MLQPGVYLKVDLPQFVENLHVWRLSLIFVLVLVACLCLRQTGTCIKFDLIQVILVIYLVGRSFRALNTKHQHKYVIPSLMLIKLSSLSKSLE